jgi:hypothetical protein
VNQAASYCFGNQKYFDFICGCTFFFVRKKINAVNHFKVLSTSDGTSKSFPVKFLLMYLSAF